MTKKQFDRFIFDDDILKELPEFKTENKKKKRNYSDNKKVLFRDNLSQLVEPVESFMLSIPRSSALDSKVEEELEEDYKRISNDIQEPYMFRKPKIEINSLDVSDLASHIESTRQNMRSMTSSEMREFGLYSGELSGESDEEKSQESSKKSLDISVHSEIDGPNISMKAESISLENGEIVNQSKQEISYDDKKGHYRFEKNGNVSEGEIEAETYSDFLKKIYEPLIGHQISSSELSLESHSDLESKSHESKISAESQPNELIINISHEQEEKQ